MDEVSERLLDFYRARGLGSKLGMGWRPAVLVVDLQRGFTDSASSLGGDLDDVVGFTRQVVDAAHRAGRPAFFTTIVYDLAVSNGGLWPKKVPGLKELVEGTPWIEIDARTGFDPARDTLIRKQYASAFFATPLASLLTAQQCDSVVVCGATTSGCVRASVVDAIQYGFNPQVVLEAVGDRAQAPHEANLFDMMAKYADLLTTQEASDYLKSAQTNRGG